MSRHGAPSGLAWQVGDVYTLHLWPPFGTPGVQQSGHYTGWALEGRLPYRLTDHALGRGARLTQLQREAGGSWVLADIEHGVTRDREHQLKYRGASRRCGVCRAERDVEAGRITREQALERAGWDRATDYERGLLLEIFGLEAAPPYLAVREPQPEPKPITPAPAFREATPGAARRDRRPGGRARRAVDGSPASRTPNRSRTRTGGKRMNETQEAAECNAVPHDRAMAAPDPEMFASMTRDENKILTAHLTAGMYKQSAVYPLLSEPWRETAAVLDDLHGAWWAAWHAEHGGPEAPEAGS